jgi:adenylosuccinate synthase
LAKYTRGLERVRIVVSVEKGQPVVDRPRVSKKKSFPKMLKRLILLSGPVCSGKTTLAEALVHQFGLGQLKTRRLIMAAKGVDHARADLQAAGEELDRATAGVWLADALTREAEGFGDGAEVIVDSVRIASQIAAIRSKFGTRVLHVHLTGPPDELAKRYKQRRAIKNSGKELASYSKVRENTTEANVDSLAKVADVVVNTAQCSADDVLVRVASHLGYFGRGMQRLVDVLVGGQWGSEGKGHIVSHLAPEYSVLLRVGGPNAGHKVYLDAGKIHSFYHLPSGTLHAPESDLVLGPGAVLYVPKLMKEIADASVTSDRLFIDPQAMIIEEADQKFEHRTLRNSIASTAQGVGVATARKVMRNKYPGGPPVRLARDIPELQPFIKPTRQVLDRAFRDGKRVFLEGTQGTGLSLHHGEYEWVTSRDTTVSGCLADAGIAPSRVRRVIMVCRTYPIRVQNPDRKGSTSGPMGLEITYDELSSRSGIPVSELRGTETTTTTGRQRRIAEFNWALLRQSSALNGPTDIALSFADYLSSENRNARRYEQLTSQTIEFIEEVERVASAPVSLISTKFEKRSIIDRRRW